MPSLLGLSSTAPVEGTLPEPGDRGILSALHLLIKPNTQQEDVVGILPFFLPLSRGLLAGYLQLPTVAELTGSSPSPPSAQGSPEILPQRRFFRRGVIIPLKD